MRYFVVVIGLTAIGALAWEFVPIQVKVWDGSFDLTVRVSSADGPLRSVRCESFARREHAEELLERPGPPGSRVWSVAAEPFAGEPLSVPVRVSGRESPCGREVGRYQFRFLAVIGELADGRRVGKLVEIPDCRVSREVSVVVP